MTNLPTRDDVLAAARAIAPYVTQTPVLTSRSLNKLFGCSIFFKCENMQHAGAFKMRGAANAIVSLGVEAAARGVATHSSGNHGAALALAAKSRGIPAVIVMPENAPKVKQQAVGGFGARIVLCSPTQKDREETLRCVQRETGAVFVHPSNDQAVISGQGTAALELMAQTPGLDLIIAPLGGGGLLSGTALAASGSPTAVIGVEPEGADDAAQSLAENRIVIHPSPKSIADGLLTCLGDLTFPLIKNYVKEVTAVSETAIVEAMRLIWSRLKVVVEPSGAVPLAALVQGKLRADGLRVGIILSGGNVDLDHLPW